MSVAPWVLPFVLLIVFEIIADIFAKEYSLKGSWWLFAAGLLGYVICNTFWLISIRNGSGLTRGAIYFSIATAGVAAIIGIFFYKEELSYVQIIGAVLGLVAIGLLAWE